MFDEDNLERAKLNLETASIPWRELQRYFAAGKVIHVSESLDLVDVAMQVMSDNKSKVEPWIAQELLRFVADDQAREWFDADESVWAIVVRPWVLVQRRK